MKKLCLFPLTPDAESILETQGMINKYCVGSIAGFREDCALLQEVAQKYNIKHMVEIDDIVDSDCILLLDNHYNSKTEKYRKIIDAAHMIRKEIIISNTLYQELSKEECLPDDVLILQNELRANEAYVNKQLFRIPVPVIGIFGLGNNCGKFDVLLRLKEVMESQNYSSVLFSSNPLGALYGSYTMPEYLYQNTLSFTEKVFAFNRDLYTAWANEKPDVIVVCCPGGVVPLGENEYNHFSEVPTIISKAVSFDLVLLTFYGSTIINYDFIQNLLDHMHYRFGLDVDLAVQSRRSVEYQSERREFRYFDFNEDYLTKHTCIPYGFKIPFVSLQAKSLTIEHMKDALKKLENNLDAV